MFIRLAVVTVSLSILHSTAFASEPGFIPGIEGKSILLVRRSDPGFQLITGGDALAGSAAALGPLHDFSGAGKSMDAGRALLEADHIADPAGYLGSRLMTDLVDTYKLRSATPDGTIIADDKALEKLVKQRPADLVFEFYTEAWRTWYFVTDFSHLDAWYYGKARLIDTQTGATLRHAKCAHKPEKTPATATNEELLAADGVKLREAIQRQQQLCLATVRKEFGIAEAQQ